MSEFFQSEIIREELNEINQLQEKLYEDVFSFSVMPQEDKIKHIEMLETLLEKQQVMYTRLCLSDDPQAIEMKDNLRKSVAMMGFPPETDLQILFSSMNARVKYLKDYIDN
jgi:GTPase Era involved in 16S rRNA processing